MDKIIVQKLKQLHFFTPYFYKKMDELARDLTRALEESFNSHIPNVQVKRSRPWKSPPKSKCVLKLSSSIPKSSAKSDSESSFENWTPQLMDLSTCSYQPTDSDDFKQRYIVSSWRHCTTNVGESDSAAEDSNPYRQPKRRRKFKRMSTDPPPVLQHSSLPSVSSFSQRCRRTRCLRSQKFTKFIMKSPKLSKITKKVPDLPPNMQDMCIGFRNVDASSGKRKRCLHERSLECSGSDNKEFASNEGINSPFLATFHPFENIIYKPLEKCNSGNSSSESEQEIFVNEDESREADDELSDYEDETESVSEASSSWLGDKVLEEKPLIRKQKGRKIKSGRRRLGRGVIPTGDILSYLPEGEDETTFVMEGCFPRAPSNEKKKRKGMPSSNNNIYGHSDKSYYQESLIPGPSEVGYPMFSKNGWKSSAAGSHRSDRVILSPGKHAHSFEFPRENQSIEAPNQSISRNSPQAPPPPAPPSSPESIFLRNPES